jgi:outer membrane biosynthesis protein TonB
MKPHPQLLILILLTSVAAAGAAEVLEGEVEAVELTAVEGPAVASSSLKPNRINAKMRQLAERLELIYQRHLDAGNQTRGCLRLEFELGDDGYVAECRIVENRLDDDDLVGRLLDNAATWYILPNRDADHPGGLSITYTFEFSYIKVIVPVAVEPLEAGTPLPPGRRIWWIHNDIEGLLPQINEIYNVYLLAAPGLEGEIKLAFTLHHDGRVTDAALVEDTVGATGLVDDIIAKVSGWRLSALEDYGPEGDVRVIYTFSFNSAY